MSSSFTEEELSLEDFSDALLAWDDEGEGGDDPTAASSSSSSVEEMEEDGDGAIHQLKAELDALQAKVQETRRRLGEARKRMAEKRQSRSEAAEYGRKQREQLKSLPVLVKEVEALRLTLREHHLFLEAQPSLLEPKRREVSKDVIGEERYRLTRRYRDQYQREMLRWLPKERERLAGIAQILQPLF